MMTDIFSSFDIYSFSLMNNLTLFLTIFLVTITLPSMQFIKNNKKMLTLHKLNFITFEFLNLTPAKNLKGMMLTLMSMFLTILAFNFMGLIPYMYSTSSHMFFSFTLAVPLWLALIISSFFYNFKSSVAHFAPAGAPEWIMSFLVIVESISVLIRPLTLSMRLAGNMTAGHIFLSLIGMFSMALLSSMSFSFVICIFTQLIFFTLESAICFIQAYVFILLLSLYAKEHM
nr:ATP synthase F0 subunit 6 [Lumbriculus variegatus]UZT67752.1 ATP synthase F0 subunit 6 [Lumbriculus variegatus]FAA04215.1 TPA: ATPase F0 subunit 6 [Lumbriculus variegatus]